MTLFQDAWLMLPVILLPAFIAGWKSGRAPVHAFKQFGKFVILTMMSHIKRI